MLEEVSLRTAEPNLVLEPYKGWEVKENYFCIGIGYIDRDLKRGEKVYLKPEEIIKLYQLTKKAVDK